MVLSSLPQKMCIRDRAQGVEGIAVGLSSKILPHNFNELCDASISYLRGEEFQLYPDFQTGGSIDVAKYNDGEPVSYTHLAANALQGADPSVNLTFGTGSPESGYSLNIRGGISVNGGTPLVLCDGVRCV